jgi:hypothetical protein
VGELSGDLPLERTFGADLSAGSLDDGSRAPGDELGAVGPRRPRAASLLVGQGDDRNRTGVHGFAGNGKGVRMALYPVVRVAQFF